MSLANLANKVKDGEKGRFAPARQEAPSWLVSALKNAKQTPLFGVLAQKTN
jgi:hypothetical protein